MRNILILIVILLTLGCESNKNDSPSELQKQKVFWASELDKSFVLGIKKQEIISWFQHKGVEPSYKESSNTISAIVSKTEGDGLVCKEWHVIIKITLNNSNEYVSHTIDQAGVCL